MNRASYLAGEVSSVLDEYTEGLQSALRAVMDAWYRYEEATTRMGEKPDAELSADVRLFETRTERLRDALMDVWLPIDEVATKEPLMEDPEERPDA